MHAYGHVCMCEHVHAIVCVCVCVCVRERERELTHFAQPLPEEGLHLALAGPAA